MLGFNTETGAYYVEKQLGDEGLQKVIDASGLDLSITATERLGQRVYVTREPYAALPFWNWANPVAKQALAGLRREYEASYATDHQGTSIPVPYGKELRPFQRAGVRYALNRKHTLIGDQPGLGKTIEAIAYANALGAERVLVICPASVRPQWEEFIRAWSTIRRLTTYSIRRTSDGVNPYANYTIVSYDLARGERIHAALMALKYDVLVLDEAHYLKTTDARRTRAIFGGLRYVPTEIAEMGEEGGSLIGHLAQRSSRVLALTGTPLPNRPRECYMVLRHMCWDAVDWISEEQFKHKYNPSMRWPSGHVEERYGHLPELRCRLRCNLMVRRLKRQVLKQLPETQFELTYVEPNGDIRRALKVESLLDIDPDHLEDIDMQTWGHISTVRREMGVAKAPRVAEHARVVLDGGVQKILIFAFHRDVVTILVEKLASYGVVVVQGGVTAEEKKRRKDKFIQDPETRIFIGQLQSVVGLDGLQTVCSWGIFAEASWTPGDNEQCVDRLSQRIGQTESVTMQFVVAPGSLDDRILGRAIEKMKTINQALDAEAG